MPNYEMVYVLRPTIPDEEIDQTVGRVTSLIESRGGTVQKTDIWGRRRLAYPLQHHREGIYVLTNFSCPPNATKEIEGQLRISEDVLRHLVIRLDKR